MKNNLRTVICLLMSFVFLFSGVVVLAENTADTGIWEKRTYVDEFDMPTDEYYVSNAEPIVGKFSNSATTDSELLTYIYVAKGEYYTDVAISIKLIEYGSNVVKNSYSKGQTYNVIMMDTAGEKHYFDGYMPSGYDAILFDKKDSQTIIYALCGNGTVYFSITKEDDMTTKYIFMIENTTGILNLLPYTSIDSLSGGRALVKKQNKVGFIDAIGNLIIPFEYNLAKSFSEGFACVAKNGKFGFIDIAGNLIIPFEYEDAHSFSEGLAGVKKGDKWGFIDTNGNLVVPYEYDEVWFSFSEGFCAVKKDGMWGFINTVGALAIPCEYDSFIDFREGLAAVQKDGMWGFIDGTGNAVIPFEYEDVNSFGEGLAPVKKDGKWSLISDSGSLAVPLEVEYDDVWFFNEGLARVEKDDAFGYIDTAGNLVIPCECSYADSSYNEGLSYINNDKGMGFIDIDGNFIISYERSSGYFGCNYGEGYFTLLKDGEIIIISRDEVQPNWKKKLAAREQKLAEQEKIREAEVEAQRLLTEYTDQEIIERVQTTLNKLGYDCGTPDGIAGKGTTGAITQYQTDKGLNITGTITHELLISLGLIES